jgi:murein L,D-transpeptidase YafK
LLGIVLIAAAANAHASRAHSVDLVKVDKSDRTLSLMSQGREIAKFHIVLGGNPIGPKQREGDQRTPEGRYILDFKKQDSAFFRAIHISYPSQADLLRAERLGVSPGGSIMIHGQKNGLGWLSTLSQQFDSTDGCIALSNEDIQRVWDLVQVPTPVEIAP